MELSIALKEINLYFSIIKILMLKPVLKYLLYINSFGIEARLIKQKFAWSWQAHHHSLRWSAAADFTNFI